MTKDELIAELNALAKPADRETAHVKADDLLIRYINDPDIEKAYEAIGKWHG